MKQTYLSLAKRSVQICFSIVKTGEVEYETIVGKEIANAGASVLI